MRRLWALVVLVPFLLHAETSHRSMRVVTAVRHWQLGDITRVAIEVSGPFEIRTDRLHKPERLYFDILDSYPSLESRRSFSEAVSDRLLKGVRVAETVPGITRVVLDLADGVQAITSELVNPNRLIVELHPGSDGADPPSPPAIQRPKPIPAPVAPVPKSGFSADAAPPPPAFEMRASIEIPVLPPPRPLSRSELAKPAEPRAAAPSPPGQAANRASDGKGKQASRTSEGENSMVRALGLKINRIVIDPGHGGHDEGSMGAKGLVEKDLVLDVSLRLGKLIEHGMGGVEVIYTRTDDTFIPLEGRTQLANEKMADLFLSIHANASSLTNVSGIETYYLNFTDSKDAMSVAARENASSQQSVFELRDLIQKISLHDKIEESREFANRVQESLQAFAARNFPGQKNRGVRKAPFMVLIGAKMPSVLAEIGFLSNPKEEALLKRADYRQKLAEALYHGVARYAGGLSHFQVAQN